MDPLATLNEAMDGIEGNELDFAAGALANYFAWRLKGGVMPELPAANCLNLNADEFALKLLNDIGEAAMTTDDDERSYGR